MPYDPDEFWRREKAFCFQDITQGEYHASVDEGFQLANKHLRNLDSKELISKETIQNVHGWIFGKVYPFAGELRDGQYLPMFGPGQDFSGAYHEAIEPELERLKSQTEELKQKASVAKEKSVEGYAQAGTFFHAKLHFIHPFRNGNSRTCLALTQAFSYHYLPERKVPEVSLDKRDNLDAYRLNRSNAQLTGNIKPLGESLLGIDIPEQSPLPIELELYVEHKQLANGLFVAVACNQAKEVHDWHEIENTPRFEQEVSGLAPGGMDYIEETVLYVGKTVEEARSLAGEAPRETPSIDFDKAPSPTRAKELIDVLEQLKLSRDFDR